MRIIKRSPTSSSATASPVAASWIYNPWLDLIVGCGAWSAPLLLISYISLASSARTWSIAFYALALFFNYPHYMATIYRAYHRAEDFQKYRIFTVHLTGLIALTLLLSHFWASLLPWIFTLYLTWSPWHYSGQNYGLFMMFARRNGAKPSASTRHALYACFIISYLVLFLSFHTGPSSDPLFLSLGIPAALGHREQVVLICGFVVLAAYGLNKLAQDTGWRNLAPSITLLSSQFLWFLLPAGISLIKGLEVPQSRYSSGILAVMHSAQYLWITSYYAQREAVAEGAPRKSSWGYFAMLILGGIALFVPGPWLASRVFHSDFTRSFLIFTALVNIHHFLVDGAIWKLRDGRIASLLLNSRANLSQAASQTGGSLVTAWQWLVGETRPARRFRMSCALLLMTGGAVDQVRYYLALHADNLGYLQSAAALNSFDSSLQTRLARRELAGGQTEMAEASLRRAVQLNPTEPAARQSLLRFLLEHDRASEAFDLNEVSLRYTPKDVNLLVDRGLLEQRLGHNDQAIASWKQAVALDPNRGSAHLYLADALERGGEPGEAATHYEQFLETVGRKNDASHPEPGKIIAIIIRMADCQARSSQSSKAIRSYGLASRLAAQTHQSKVESVAEINEAALQGDQGQTAEALQLYQSALRLDEADGDRTVSAEDWLAYGNYLQQAGLSARASYASLTKSQTLQEVLPSRDEQQLRAERIQQIERKLGRQAEVIRRDLDAAANEALAVKVRQP